MISAYCPGHITCFFRPVYDQNIFRTGSRGAGIRTSAGTTVTLEETAGTTKIFINSKRSEAKVTRSILEHMAPGRDFVVRTECDLPLAQGFGMSASGAVATALCIASIIGKSRQEAYEAAHTVEVECGGGLGDVAALTHAGDLPIRIGEGVPPYGKVIDPGITFDELSVVIMGPKLETGNILGNSGTVNRICDAGDKAMNEFANATTKKDLFRISNEFAENSKVINEQVSRAIYELNKNGIRASMCMLGNSIFSDAPREKISNVLGSGVEIITTGSTSKLPEIIRKE